MEESPIPPRLLRIARRYNLYLVLGILIVVSALALGAWEASALQTMGRLEDAGRTDTAEYVQAEGVADFIRIVNPTWNFVGLGFLTFGIGMSIVVIVFHLTGAGLETMGAYKDAFPEAQLPRPPKPRFATLFPKLLFLGLALIVLNFLFAVSGGLAATGFLTVSFAGFTSASWASFAEVLRTPQRPGTMGFIILGIGLSLATIVYNLRLQARLLPHLLGALHAGTPAELPGNVRPRLPRLPFALLAFGFVVLLSASYPVGLLGALAGADLVAAGGTNPAAARQLAWASGLFPVIAVTGIVFLLAGIVYWLLLIIQALRDQRDLIGRVGLTLAGAKPQPLEQPLWPEKAAAYFAGAGVMTLLMLFVPAALLIHVRWELLRLGGAAGANLAFLDHFLRVLIPDLRFIGFALVMLGIGLTLGVILINLKGIGSILPGTMSKVLQSKGQAVAPAAADADEGDVEARALNAMNRWPHKLFAPLLIGALIMISTTFPLVVPLHLTPQLAWKDAVEAGDMETAAELELQMAVLGALREPWNFIGMGLIFFAIGRFFGTIIGFVNARKVLISDTCHSLVPGGTSG